MRVKIHHEGTDILVIAFLAVMIISVPLWLWGPVPLAIAATTVLGVMYLLVVNFFRSPKRTFHGDRTNAVIASADGTVVALEETYEDEYLHDKAIQVSVFMSVLNVHANWFPVDGEVVYCKHHPGRFMAAYLPKSSTDNERSTVVIHTPGGQNVLVRQIAGAIARRIVTYARPGDEASIEDHMGFIKFGSRVDIYLPANSTVYVKIGDKTIGGISKIGHLNP